MKFTNFKIIALVVIITLSATFATKLSALTKDGGGDWNNGFTCPELHIDGKNQGEVKILAKKVVDATGEDVYGMLFQFSETPGALFKKVGRDFGDNKWRVAYRKMTNKFIYVNPWGNKYISGSVYDEAGKTYTLKIVLPHKTFGWYINDEQGNKIKSNMNTRATSREQAVSENKDKLQKNYPNYVSDKKQVEALSKNRADYEKYVEAQKTQLKTLKGQIEALRTTAGKNQKAVETKTNALLGANIALDVLLRKESALGNQKSAINESIEVLSKNKDDLAGKKALFTNDVKEVKKTLDAEYANLLANAPQRETDINASKTALYASEKADFQSNLNKIYP